MNIGFIGLGKMGSVMAPLLTRTQNRVAGFDLNYSLPPDSPVKRAGKLEELAGCDVIITMLPEGSAVLQVISDLLAAGAGGLFIDLSSCHPETGQQAAEMLAPHGNDFIDAPVSGGVARARTGELMIMAGGSEEGFERAAPLLGNMGRAVHVGPCGAGYAMKSLNNYVSAAGLVASFQALATARGFGIAPQTFQTVINASTGRNNTTEVKIDRFVINEAFNSGFALALMAKDVSIASDIIKKQGFDAPVTPALSAYLFDALDALGQSADHTEIYRHLSNARDRQTAR